MTHERRISVFYRNHFVNHGATHTCISIASAMRQPNLKVLVVGIGSAPGYKSPIYKDGIPKIVQPLMYKLLSQKKLNKFAELIYRFKLKSSDIAYVWPGASLELFKILKDRGNLIVVENINCHQRTSRKIIEEEFYRLGLKPEHKITDQSVNDESEKLALCDYAFCPSPMVSQSLLDEGIEEKKILPSSYGLDRNQQLPFQSRTQHKEKSLNAIFVGRIGVRKGIHLLLDYWVKSKVNATLKVIGNIEKSAEPLIAPYRKIPNIEFIKFLSKPDLTKTFQNADFFVLPSLEEGSPLVTYEAIGAGLPCIVSPMGGGGIICDGQQGYVIQPHDEKGWINSIISLCNNAELRESMGKSAWDLSSSYIWDEVGQRRASQLMAKI